MCVFQRHTARRKTGVGREEREGGGGGGGGWQRDNLVHLHLFTTKREREGEGKPVFCIRESLTCSLFIGLSAIKLLNFFFFRLMAPQQLAKNKTVVTSTEIATVNANVLMPRLNSFRGHMVFVGFVFFNWLNTVCFLWGLRVYLKIHLPHLEFKNTLLKKENTQILDWNLKSFLSVWRISLSYRVRSFSH